MVQMEDMTKYLATIQYITTFFKEKVAATTFFLEVNHSILAVEETERKVKVINNVDKS